jgi:hypothetical protein
MIGSRGAQCLDWIVKRVGSVVDDGINMTTSSGWGGPLLDELLRKVTFAVKEKTRP